MPIDRKRHFDLEAFYRVLDSTRHGRGLNWKQVSNETGVSASTLTRMSQDKRPDADSLTALAAWAGINPADYVTNAGGAQVMEPLAAISRHLYRDPNLTQEGAAALDEMLKAAYQRFAQKRRHR
jgi:transcriptional regulator with XRE-family HTH domain